MNYLKEVKSQGIKTTWLAEQLGISQPLMHMKLSGKRAISPEEEKKLAKILSGMAKKMKEIQTDIVGENGRTKSR